MREGAAALKYFHNVRCVSSVDSTNALALSLLDDTSAPGLTIFADVQTAGRGRAGRTWASPGGAGLLMSTIMPIEMPQSALPALGYWTSLCAADAIIDACGVWPTLKWPNDLMLGALKIAGVLIEGRTLGAFTRAVIGLGVNANRPPEVPADLEGAAAWLSDASGSPIDRTALALAILRAYDRRYDSLIAKPLDAIREWSRRSAISGRTLRVSDAQGEPLHEGIARGLSDDGALLLETKDGPVAVRLGDVSAL
ncbi:MAG: biotin--[acetyl-CoA-carboxylase] ligase [Candidatus Eremiobacteraeota bacterium]|nr:biotin--[acetyl-CoA-carboxylase] ligase [Candidatus Eremiobacteraeota bacterium]MBV8366935.1 biotin--[acetyl-CoA-carboxylase] ligase [Candidatus Eremiobacteraeota bacterium]